MKYIVGLIIALFIVSGGTAFANEGTVTDTIEAGINSLVVNVILPQARANMDTREAELRIEIERHAEQVIGAVPQQLADYKADLVAKSNLELERYAKEVKDDIDRQAQELLEAEKKKIAEQTALEEQAAKEKILRDAQANPTEPVIAEPIVVEPVTSGEEVTTPDPVVEPPQEEVPEPVDEVITPEPVEEPIDIIVASEPIVIVEPPKVEEVTPDPIEVESVESEKP